MARKPKAVEVEEAPRPEREASACDEVPDVVCEKRSCKSCPAFKSMQRWGVRA